MMSWAKLGLKRSDARERDSRQIGHRVRLPAEHVLCSVPLMHAPLEPSLAVHSSKRFPFVTQSSALYVIERISKVLLPCIRCPELQLKFSTIQRCCMLREHVHGVQANRPVPAWQRSSAWKQRGGICCLHTRARGTIHTARNLCGRRYQPGGSAITRPTPLRES